MHFYSIRQMNIASLQSCFKFSTKQLLAVVQVKCRSNNMWVSSTAMFILTCGHVNSLTQKSTTRSEQRI